MRAFHSDSKIKAKYLKRVRAHIKADEVVKGKYWEKGKGCAVGCTIHSDDHLAYEVELGIPVILARLEDCIFESLPNDLAKTWPERFLKAIKPGADLSKVWAKFAIWLLIDKENGVVKHTKKATTIKNINVVANLYLRSLKEEVTIKEWADAASNAAKAAYTAYAAYYAAYAADADAAYAAYAAYAAAKAAADAAYAAYAAASADYAASAARAVCDAAAEAARANVMVKQSENLLQLLKECK